MTKQSAIVRSVVLIMALAISLAIPAAAQFEESVNSSPPDLTHYFRPALPQDVAPAGKSAIRPSIAGSVFPGIIVVDTVVNNTDPTLTNTDTFSDTEPSIAISPDNPNNIVITAFSGAWSSPGSFAPWWQSTDGGNTWTKQFTIPAPPGISGAAGCPCDQEVDYARGGAVSGTFLTVPTNVYSGTSTDPSSSAAFMWNVIGGVTQRTNSAGVNIADQPQLMLGVDPFVDQDDIYVAYDDFSGSPNMRVAGSPGTSPSNPPDFSAIDNLTGFSTGFVNPGHRLTTAPVSGAVYSLFQQVDHLNPDGSKNINFILNRSTDGGQTWGLNGSPTGVIVANGDSVQPTPKFGTVNALLGGVDHVAVDPGSGDVYVVYGNRDSATRNTRLSIVRLTDDGAGGLIIGPSNFVTDQVEAALPSVAVTNDALHTVGVLYDTFDGFDPTTTIPMFSAHLAISQDQGITFTDQVLETFLSPAKDSGNQRQRVLGDYQQLKAVGSTFYGVFTGNGVPFGRPFSNTDAIFFRTDAPPPAGSAAHSKRASMGKQLTIGMVP